MNKILIVLTVLGMMVSAKSASAADKKTAEIDNMNFPDESLVDPKISIGQQSIVTRPAPVRTVLVRPRTSFIAEMLQTIEDI